MIFYPTRPETEYHQMERRKQTKSSSAVYRLFMGILEYPYRRECEKLNEKMDTADRCTGFLEFFLPSFYKEGENLNKPNALIFFLPKEHSCRRERYQFHIMRTNEPEFLHPRDIGGRYGLKGRDSIRVRWEVSFSMTTPDYCMEPYDILLSERDLEALVNFFRQPYRGIWHGESRLTNWQYFVSCTITHGLPSEAGRTYPMPDYRKANQRYIRKRWWYVCR